MTYNRRTPSRPQPFPKIGRMYFVVFILLLLIGIAAYWSIMNNTLIGDDFFYTVKAGELSPTGLWHLFDMHPSFVRPVPSFIFWLQFKAFGTEGTPSHLINIFVHAGNAFLMFWLLVKLGVSMRPAMLGALLFIVTPVAAEPVTWSSGRFDLFATFFVLLAAVLYLTAVRKDSIYAYAGALVAAFAAMLSKESAMILVIIFPALELLYGVSGEHEKPAHTFSRRRLQVSGIRLTVFYALFAGYIAMRYAILGRLGGYKEVPFISVPEPLTVLKTTWTFLSPVSSRMVSVTFLVVIGSLFLSLLIISQALVICRWRRATKASRKAWVFLVIFFISTLLPVNTQLFKFGIGHGLKDSRELYIVTLLAISIIIVGLFNFGWHKKGWRIFATVTVVLLSLPWLWGLNKNNELWERSAVIAHTIFETTNSILPDPPPNAKMYFLGIPDWDGAYLPLGALKHAIADKYGRKDLQVKHIKYLDPEFKISETKDGYLFSYDLERNTLTLVHEPD